MFIVSSRLSTNTTRSLDGNISFISKAMSNTCFFQFFVFKENYPYFKAFISKKKALSPVRKVNYTYCSTIFFLCLLLYIYHDLDILLVIPKGTLGFCSIHMAQLITHAVFMQKPLAMQ